jgi:site-specific recombinase XerD
MVTWAVKNEWIDKDPFSNYKLNFKRTEREFLSREEMNLIETAQLDVPMLLKVRDLFMFSCYTGLSFIDMITLKPHQIVDGTDGVQWITMSRTKTDIPVHVPLLQSARLILDKFKDDQSAMVNETVFPPITNQEMNRSLKIIGGLCKMKKQLTFHMARHTFATTVTLMNGVPIESISKMLGHSKITPTMIYARVSQSKLEWICCCCKINWMRIERIALANNSKFLDR